MKMDNKNEKTLTEFTSDRILAWIKENDLKPGDRLPSEKNLMKMFSVGRGTLREAVKYLVSYNIVETRQGAGTFISYKNGISEDPLGLILEDVDERLLYDMLEVRMILEPEIAGMAAVNATTPQIDELFEICSELKKYLEEKKSYIEIDAKLHGKIAECSGNRIITKLAPIITSSIQMNIDETEDCYKVETYLEHKFIIEMIANHDQRGARYAMIAHLNAARNGIVKRRKDSIER